MASGLPPSAPVSMEEREVHESLGDLKSRIEALEALPHTIESEYHSVEASPGSVISTVKLQHGLSRRPRGAWLIATGEESDAGTSQPTDVILTLDYPASTVNTATLMFRRMITAGAITRTFHILLF